MKKWYKISPQLLNALVTGSLLYKRLQNLSQYRWLIDIEKDLNAFDCINLANFYLHRDWLEELEWIDENPTPEQTEFSEMLGLYPYPQARY